MSNPVKEIVKQECVIFALNSWDAVIEDVQRKIKESEDRTKGLKRIVKDFEALRDSGQPFHAATHN